jgi:diguanylate cyclase (GGDEF)-like protein
MDSLNAATSGWPLYGLLAATLFSLGVAGLALGLLVAQKRRRRNRRRAGDPGVSQLDSSVEHDPITGLMSRSRFELAFEDAVARCDHGSQSLSVLYLDLDSFRLVNDAYGHDTGDRALAEAARRLRGALDSPRACARLAADEFAVLVDGGIEQASKAAAAMLAALRRPLTIDSAELRLDASIGIAIYPQHGSRPRLLGHASTAMRAVKQAGGGAFAEFEPSMGVDMRQQAELLRDLRRAIELGQLQLVYQPKIDAASLQVTAAEALLRWHHPTRGVVSPGVFVPLAERHGLITDIGRWVIEEACRQAAEWRKLGLHMRVAVNISGYQLRQDDLVDSIEKVLRKHGVAPGRFTCEITETVAMEDTRVTRAAFDRLRAAGVHVSIDDFGTGHSSLASLRRLPAAELKIDRAFVTDLASSDEARSIAVAVVQMAHSLDMRVVAEGVETERQRDLLVEIGCDELQGYLFAKPMSARALAMWATDDDHDRGPSSLGFRASLFKESSAAPLS